jgi:hypothetical protein
MEGVSDLEHQESSRMVGGMDLGRWVQQYPGIVVSGATGTSELQRSVDSVGQKPYCQREAAGRSELDGVNHPVLQHNRWNPKWSRVFVFEMWIAEVGQTHLW